jgi:hypothetical protein
MHATISETEKYKIVILHILVRVTAMEQYMLEGTAEVFRTYTWTQGPVTL